jgi:predicted GIY-YIG superfamily endonuclease
VLRVVLGLEQGSSREEDRGIVEAVVARLVQRSFADSTKPGAEFTSGAAMLKVPVAEAFTIASPTVVREAAFKKKWGGRAKSQHLRRDSALGNGDVGRQQRLTPDGAVYRLTE